MVTQTYAANVWVSDDDSIWAMSQMRKGIIKTTKIWTKDKQ